jgi:hypothetical protein
LSTESDHIVVTIPTQRPPRWRRWVKWLAIFFVIAVISGELLARYYFGLGDPPLLQADPQIEYLFQPSHTYHRFGNLIHYNAYSMRSDDFPPHKIDPRELRVMVIGDSVINGGTTCDQSKLATSILQRQLIENLHRPVVVGNMSAGSWGPPNQVAYVKRYGLFDADIVVLVVSSHDIVDVPTFEPLVGVNLDFPNHTPPSALWEGITRYIPKVWWRLTHKQALQQASMAIPTTMSTEAIEQCSQAIQQIISIARENGAKVIVAQHLEIGELNGHELPGHGLVREVATSMGIEPLQMGPAFQESVKEGVNPYETYIHPSPEGQAVIAKVLLPEIEKIVASGATSQAASTRP